MKRQKRTGNPGRKNKAVSSAPAVAPDKAISRRDLMAKLSNGGLVVAIGGGVGWFFVDEVCATTRENDLSRLGNGIPAVVQIHDPECPMCRALQKETRKAMSAFDESKLQYLVANIRRAKGRDLANRHGVGHVTLLLFDGEGKRRGILRGQKSSDYLEDMFRGHLNRVSGK